MKMPVLTLEKEPKGRLNGGKLRLNFKTQNPKRLIVGEQNRFHNRKRFSLLEDCVMSHFLFRVGRKKQVWLME